MKANDLFYAVGDADWKHIDVPPEQALKEKKRMHMIRFVAFAACFVLVAAVGCGVHFGGDSSASIVYPHQNQACLESNAGSLSSQITYYSYDQLASGADMVIVADVIEHYQEPTEHDSFLLYAKVSVQEVVKGTAKKGDILYVGDNGTGYRDAQGNYGGAYTSCGGPLLETGNRVLLFVVNPGAKPGNYFTTAEGVALWTFDHLTIGKFFLDTDGKYHASAVYAQSYPDRYSKDVMLSDYEPKTLQDIKALIVKNQ